MIKSLFEFPHYKDYLRHRIHAKGSQRGLQSALARHLGCQASYLYQILKGKGELTEDQAFRATSFFKFNEAERRYFLLSLRIAKAASPELVRYLSEELRSLVEQQMDLKNKVDSSLARDDEKAWRYYFSSDMPSLIHIMTSSDKYRSIEALAKKLNVPADVIARNLEELEQHGFVTQKSGSWSHASPSIHFPKNSPFNLNLQLIRKTQAMHSVMRANELPNALSLHYSSLFSVDRKSLEQLRLMVSEFVENTQKKIHDGGTDEVAIFCIDLFSPLA